MPAKNRYIAIGMAATDNPERPAFFYSCPFERKYAVSVLDCALEQMLEQLGSRRVESFYRIEIYPLPEIPAVVSDNPPLALDAARRKHSRYRTLGENK
jgi:hypothetical protein